LIPREAFYDAYFLLSRGYSRKNVLDLIAARYRLGPIARRLLGRCVHGSETNRAIRAKLVEAGSVRRECLAVDVYNQLATIYAAMTGLSVYVCSDGLARDALAGATSTVTRHREGLARLLAGAVEALKPSRLYLVVDSQPSRSALLAATLRSILPQAEVWLEKKADKRLIGLSRICIIASSDIVVVKRARRVFDLAIYTIRLSGAERAVTDITRMLREQHGEWCRAAGP